MVHGDPGDELAAREIPWVSLAANLLSRRIGLDRLVDPVKAHHGPTTARERITRAEFRVRSVCVRDGPRSASRREVLAAPRVFDRRPTRSETTRPALRERVVTRLVPRRS